MFSVVVQRTWLNLSICSVSLSRRFRLSSLFGRLSLKFFGQQNRLLNQKTSRRHLESSPFGTFVRTYYFVSGIMHSIHFECLKWPGYTIQVVLLQKILMIYQMGTTLNRWTLSITSLLLQVETLKHGFHLAVTFFG